jgi:hypothetical protein
MPDLWDKDVAASMSVEHWSGQFLKPSGVAPMDIDTPEPAHADAAGPASTTATDVFGTPVLTVDSVAPVVFSLSNPGPARNITVRNAGTRISAYRVVPSSTWIRTSLDGGVALGAEMGGTPSTLQISVDLAQLPGDYYEGSVLIEPVVGGGQPARISVIASRSGQGMLFEGWNALDYSGAQVPWWEVTNTLTAMINPGSAWTVAARLDSVWLTHFRNPPLPSFNTLPDLLPGARHWLFVTGEATLAP